MGCVKRGLPNPCPQSLDFEYPASVGVDINPPNATGGTSRFTLELADFVEHDCLEGPTLLKDLYLEVTLYPWGLGLRYRILQPRELAAAQGFPEDSDFAGNKTETTEQSGMQSQ